MKLDDFPLIFKLLKDDKLTPTGVVENDKLICANANGDEYLMKECRGIEEKIFTQVIPAIKEMKLDFKVLELPEHLKVVAEEHSGDNQSPGKKFILMKLYKGIIFNQTWNETSAVGYGGRGIEVDLADKVISLLEDFSLIEVERLSSFGLLTFNFERWKSQNFPIKFKHLVEHGILTEQQLEQGLSILNSPGIFQNSKMVFTNGDFYPRNFIELNTGKVVVIDWEGRTDYEGTIDISGTIQKFTGQRNALINFIENHAAFFFVHMWGNYRIQRKFLKGVSREFGLSVDNLQAALIIKSLEQAFAFRREYLALRQAEIFVHALDKEYVQDLIR